GTTYLTCKLITTRFRPIKEGNPDPLAGGKRSLLLAIVMPGRIILITSCMSNLLGWDWVPSRRSHGTRQRRFDGTSPSSQTNAQKRGAYPNDSPGALPGVGCTNCWAFLNPQTYQTFVQDRTDVEYLSFL